MFGSQKNRKRRKIKNYIFFFSHLVLLKIYIYKINIIKIIKKIIYLKLFNLYMEQLNK